MYKVLVDGSVLCDSRIDDLTIISPVVTLAMNSAGSFVFTLPPEHPKYDVIQRKKSIITVYRDDDAEPIFQGFVSAEDVDMFKQKKITCEGELSYFNDSVLRPARYQNVTPLFLLTTYIALHNEQVEESKRFDVGNVTVSGNINCYTNMQSTMTEIKEDLIDDFGGYMRVRYANGHKYIDYLADAPQTASQPIELGKNLTDYKSNIDDVDIATRVVPLGKTQEESTDIPGLQTHLTIASVNDGKDYLQSDTAVAQFGIITKTIEFSDVNTPSILKTKGQQYLDEVQFENVVIEASAIDFGYLTEGINKFRIMDYVHVKSEAHGMDKWFILTKMTLNLNNPENDRFTFGKNEKLSLTARTTNVSAEIAKAIANLPSPDYIQQAIAQATAMITGANGGFVRFNYDEDGNPYEILVMDTDDIETATKVWRWNQNGFGYSSSGYDGPYGTAITMDGGIVADYITSGMISGIKVRTGNPSGWRAEMDKGNIFIYGKRSGQSDYTKNGFLGAVNGPSTTAMSIFVEDADAFDLGINTENGLVVYYFLNNGENPAGKTERHYFRESMRVTGNLSVEGGISSGYSLSASFVSAPHLYIPYISDASSKVDLYAYTGDPLSWGYSYNRLHIDSGIDCTGRINTFTGYSQFGDVQYGGEWAQSYRLMVNGQIYCNGINSGSDRKLKRDIEDVDEKYIELFDNIRPKSFKLNDDESMNTHLGYVAQDIEEAMREVGINADSSSLITKGQTIIDGEETELRALNYIELMTMYDLKIRQLEKRIEELEEKLNV